MSQSVSAARKPGRPRDEAIDAAILDATIDELIERGFLGLTMEAIAARAGVAKTTLYRRWPGTDELALEAMRSFTPRGVLDAPDASARDTLMFLLDGMRRTWADPRYGALMRRVAADGTGREALYRHFREKLIGPHVQRMTQALQRAVDEGLIRPDVDLAWVRQLMVSPIMAAALTHKDRVSRAQLEFALDTVLAGLRP
jgi:AcrR family transcriptional regulator